jgi:hypothetical protein
MALETTIFVILSLRYFSFLRFFFHIREREELSLFFNVKNWEYIRSEDYTLSE